MDRLDFPPVSEARHSTNMCFPFPFSDNVQVLYVNFIYSFIMVHQQWIIFKLIHPRGSHEHELLPWLFMNYSGY